MRTFQIRVMNHSSYPISVIGSNIGPRSDATEDLPIEVPATGSKTIRIHAAFVGSAGRFQDSFSLYTDDYEHAPVVGWFNGRVLTDKSLRTNSNSEQ